MRPFLALLLCFLAAVVPVRAADLPPINRVWNGDDYKQTADALAASAAPLPTLADSQGQAFVRRLTALENFAALRNESVPFETRLSDYSKTLTGLGAILTQYAEAANKGTPVHTELAQMMAFMLRLSTAGKLMVDKYVPTIPRDGKYAARMDGLKKMQGGLMQIFGGAEVSLGEKTFYSASDLSLLLDSMGETLPVVKSWFSPEYTAELRKKLEADKPGFLQPKDDLTIRTMIAKLGT